MSDDGQYDVVGIGNAIVDVISQESEEFVVAQDLNKGAMTLIDDQRAVELYAAMSPAIETSGGSAANTVSGIASFGGSVAFIGKVRNDQLGAVFEHDIRAVGVDFEQLPGRDGLPTGRSLIVVTPDAARTMNTFLGISSLLHPDDIDVDMVRQARVLYCEGYIWDVDITKAAIRKAVDECKAAGNQVSFTLSDSFCVERHHSEWLELAAGPIDILFGNEEEISTLYRTDDLDAAIAAVRQDVPIGCITRGPAGSVIVTADDTIVVEAEPVDEVVDTTGAGDLYASGFLYGHCNGVDLETCGRLASIAAAEVISHVGARSATPLDRLARDAGIVTGT
ncbi:MAG: adenosine kinase [Acidimicrobiales bacterium]